MNLNQTSEIVMSEEQRSCLSTPIKPLLNVPRVLQLIH